MEETFTLLNERCSDWAKFKRIMAYVLLFIANVVSKKHKRHGMTLRSDKNQIPELSVYQISQAEIKILQIVQRFYFSEELKPFAEKSTNVTKESKIYRLDPFIGEVV